MKKINMYLFNESVEDFGDCLKSRNEERHYKSIRGSQNVNNLNYEVYLVSGIPKPPGWISFIEPYVETNRIINLRNVTNSLLILIKVPTSDGERIFAISEGFGYHIINRDKIASNFGLKTTLNSIDPLKIKAIDVKSLGVQTLQRKEATNSAMDFKEFSFEFDADILRALNGNCQDNELGTKIGGSDNLILTADIDFPNLAHKCQQVYEQYTQTTYKQAFEFIDYVQHEKEPATIASLDTHLIEAINNQQDDLMISVAYPDQIEYDRCSIFRISGLRNPIEVTDVELADIYDYIHGRMQNAHSIDIECLKKRIKITGFDSNGTALVPADPAYEYLTFETEFNGISYVLCNGKWYAINRDFLRSNDQEIKMRINLCDTNLIDWVKNPNNDKYEEGHYNSQYNLQPDFLYLDKSLYYFPRTTSSIEVADFYSLHGNKLFCVKKANRSSTLSHLFSQATVSASLFKDHEQYRQAFIRQVINRWPSHFHDSSQIEDLIKKLTFVYAIGTNRQEGILDILPIFSRINLLKHARILTRFGYDVEVAKISLV